MMLQTSLSAWISQFLACIGSCFGCSTKSQPITAVDAPAKGLKIQGLVVKKPSISEDFWSTSTYDNDHSTVLSQRSLSSISMSNQKSHNVGISSTSDHSEFINHGLLLWNQTRLQWVGNKRSQSRGKVQNPVLSWNASYESLLGNSKKFPQLIPLSEMVDFLVDIWEQEGLYD
ncbi:Hypothetical predicted protein [Olea europaea subsp. europaea]|uniref:Gag1-like clamp domain-containing protein n=1 Tax=Olea europaea subsp. europaea TaxID=158383 RepID=A0A8S0T2P9_OLEEU|nr:Hypothetical predicted protein [Olea europaea subsp. europaea]